MPDTGNRHFARFTMVNPFAPLQQPVNFSDTLFLCEIAERVEFAGFRTWRFAQRLKVGGLPNRHFRAITRDSRRYACRCRSSLANAARSMMLHKKLTRRWLEEFAADHDGQAPTDFTWRRSFEWDREHANSDELAEREFDKHRLVEAFELAEAGDFLSALRIWSDMAEQGSVWSMIEVGRCYQFGRGVPRDPAEAESWFRRAFAGGSQVAMLKCAKAAASRNDRATCEAILQVGVNQDWVPAIFWQAWYRHRWSESKATYQAIFPMLKIAAARGHPAARMVLASCMLRGKFGLFRVPIGFLLSAKAGFDENFDGEQAKRESLQLGNVN